MKSTKRFSFDLMLSTHHKNKLHFHKIITNKIRVKKNEHANSKTFHML